MTELNMEELNHLSFGAFIKQRREELGISLRSLAKDLDVSSVYVFDIECGNKYAPNNEEFLTKLFRKLNITPSEEEDLRIMIRINRKDGIDDYLMKQPLAKVALRMAEDANVSDDEWKEFISRLKQLNKEKEQQ